MQEQENNNMVTGNLARLYVSSLSLLHLSIREELGDESLSIFSSLTMLGNRSLSNFSKLLIMRNELGNISLFIFGHGTMGHDMWITALPFLYC